jgi:hypothetical protein
MTEDDLLLTVQALVNAHLQSARYVRIRALEVGRGASRVRVEFGDLLPGAEPSVTVPTLAPGGPRGLDHEQADDTSAPSEPDDSPELPADPLDTAHLD